MKCLVCFSAFLQTDAKASVLKADEELCERLSASAMAISQRDVTSLSLTDK